MMFRNYPRVPSARLHVYSRLYFHLIHLPLGSGFPKRVMKFRRVLERCQFSMNFGVGKIPGFHFFTICASNDVGHLDFGWSGGMCRPAGRGGGLKPSILDLEGVIKPRIPTPKLVGPARHAISTGGAAESASAHSAGPRD